MPALFLCLVTLTFDHLAPKISGFSGLIVERFCVKFGDHSYRGFWDIVLINIIQTDRQTPEKTLPRDCRQRGYMTFDEGDRDDDDDDDNDNHNSSIINSNKK